MDEQKTESVEEHLKEMLDHQRNMTNNAHQTISHLSGELMFWKKLALSQLGVDSQKVNELVQYMGFGGLTTGNSAVTSTLRR